MSKKTESGDKKSKLSTESYKGVRDFYPKDQVFLNYLFKTCRDVAERFGYVEYHASILEPSELYKSKGAENEEIVNEQTYTFVDRGGREVTLRPEMTPTVARMVSAKRRELGFPLRLFSIPNLFRYERPQRGRLREHWQLNVDLFGSKSPASDAEIVMVAYQLMRTFGAKDEDFEIRINSREVLNREAEKYNLTPEEKKELANLIDKKAKMPDIEFEKIWRRIVKEDLLNFQVFEGTSAPKGVEEILSILRGMDISNIKFDPSIMRGFDYYTGMVFEVFDTHPDNNRALFGGGRYDNLTAMFDDEPISGVGFGMGDVTIENFLSVRGLLKPYVPSTQVYLVVSDKSLVSNAQEIATELRNNGINVAVDFGEKKLADQIKTATKHKIPYLIVVGENEISSETYKVRNLETGEEVEKPRNELAAYLQSI